MTDRSFARWSHLGGRAAIIAVLASTAWTATAHAQLVLARRYHGPTPAKQDWHAFSAAARKLLNSDKPEIGRSEHWAAPGGNHGTLTIRRVFTRAGMPCRVVDSRIVDRKARTKHDYTLTACHVASGEWKLAD